MASPYWEHRAALRQAAYDKANNQVVADISKAYDRATAQLNLDIDHIIGVYTRKTGLSAQEARAYLNEGVPTSILDSLRLRASQIGDIGERKRLGTILRTDAYRARISRIDAINDAVRVGMTEAADVELSLLTPHLKNTADMAYSRMMFDVQKASGFGFQMVGVPTSGLDAVLKSRWAGMSYSQSVWQNRDAMVGLLQSALSEQVSIGKLSDITRSAIRDGVDTKAWTERIKKNMKSKFKNETQYAKYAANRLVRTESAYVAGQTAAVAYDECGIEKYEYLSTLDSRTSEKCAGLDGKIFKVSEKEVGVNYPPAHPFCRSSTVGVIDGKSLEGLTRASQGKDGKTVKIPRSMNYHSWKAWQDAGAPDLKTWLKE